MACHPSPEIDSSPRLPSAKARNVLIQVQMVASRLSRLSNPTMESSSSRSEDFLRDIRIASSSPGSGVGSYRKQRPILSLSMAKVMV